MGKRRENPQAHSLAALPKSSVAAPSRQRQSGVPTVRAPTAERERVQRLYLCKRPEEVSRFLQAHPHLVPLLVEAHSQIEIHFGPSREVTLEVVADPEVHELVELFGYITLSLTPEEAGERLQRFDREWFLSQAHRAKGLLNFDVEFR